MHICFIWKRTMNILRFGDNLNLLWIINLRVYYNHEQISTSLFTQHDGILGEILKVNLLQRIPFWKVNALLFWQISKFYHCVWIIKYLTRPLSSINMVHNWHNETQFGWFCNIFIWTRVIRAVKKLYTSFVTVQSDNMYTNV